MLHMRIYLAGPMSGYPNFNFAAFDFAARKLRDLGFGVFSPAENERENNPTVEDNPTGDGALAEKTTGFTRRNALEQDTSWICREAHAIAPPAGMGEIHRGHRRACSRGSPRSVHPETWKGV